MRHVTRLLILVLGIAGPALGVEIAFTCGEFHLVGDLLTPPGPPPHPAVIYVWGSGPTDRAAHIERSTILRGFLEAGFAVFIDDKPGSGQSTGRLDAGRMLHQRAEILAEAMQVVERHPDIDARAIGLYGSSQASYVMAIALSQGLDPAFMIAWSCPMQSSLRQSAYLVRQYLLCDGATEAEAIAAEQAFIARRQAQSYAEYREAATHLDAIAAIRDELGWAGIVAEEHFTPADTLTSESFLDPSALITRFDMPVLALFAANDRQIDPLQGAAAYRRLQTDRDDGLSRVVVIPDADHNMILSPRGCMQDQADRYQAVGGMTLAPAFRDTLTAWLGELKRTLDTPPLRILILGGTGFIGPWQVEAARTRGHEVTLFNRGKTRPDLFPDIEHLVGDRDPDKDDGLSALAGRQFDVVIDNSGFYPRHVKASAELLAPNVGQYIYVSSISAYQRTDLEHQDEAAPVATMDDPTVETMGDDYANYGPLKALCEAAAEAAMPGRVTVVRPGYIVGPGDRSHRFTYWPLRVRQGGQVAVPGHPDDPIQVIDARDLAEWIIHLAERNITGVFTACGPDRRLTMREVVETARTVTGSQATFTWLGMSFQQTHPDVYFPIWTPYEGEYRGFHTFSIARAQQAGLTFRPLEQTITDLLVQFDGLPEETRDGVLARIPVAGEQEMLEGVRRGAR